MKFKIIIFVTLFITSCKNNDNEIGNPENYILTKKDISDDCNSYQMLFYEGNYIFRFALAGRCKDLKYEKYMNQYSSYLTKYRNKLLKRRGFIILDDSESIINHNLQNSILTITKNHFKTNVSVIEMNENRITIKVFD